MNYLILEKKLLKILKKRIFFGNVIFPKIIFVLNLEL